MTKKERVIKIINELKKLFIPKTALKYAEPFQMLVSTILSAQCRDELVNKVTEKFYDRFKTAEDFNKLTFEELDEMIKSINIHRNKAKNILASAKEIVEKYSGKIPNTMEELTSLPGVGRKTANVVLGEIHKISVGIVVDTHVKRLSNRIGLTKNSDPHKIEIDLKKVTPPEYWIDFSHLLIYHGRKICIARKPKCYECPIRDLCLYKKKNLKED